jgi:hypothetical protein
MHASATAILVIVVVAVVALAAWPVSVALAGRKPHQAARRQDNVRGRVQGGTHVGGGGRSVAPPHDEEVIPGELPDEADPVSGK